jgi:hypothetical protein
MKICTVNFIKSVNNYVGSVQYMGPKQLSSNILPELELGFCCLLKMLTKTTTFIGNLYKMLRKATAFHWKLYKNVVKTYIFNGTLLKYCQKTTTLIGNLYKLLPK